MSLDKTIVIELGAPSGFDSAGLAPLAACIQRHVMAGQRVIAVVSPPQWRGSKDVQTAERLGASSDGHARAMLVGSGAIDTAERLAGTLADRGLRVARVDAERSAVVTRGHPLDAQPRHASGLYFAKALTESQVVVVPAGVGVDEYRRATHLGENAGALTALFLADAFGLPVTLEASLGGGTLGSRKARLFARDREIEFAVGDSASPVGAWVGRRGARREPRVGVQRARVKSGPMSGQTSVPTSGPINGGDRMAASA